MSEIGLSSDGRGTCSLPRIVGLRKGDNVKRLLRESVDRMLWRARVVGGDATSGSEL